MSCALKLGRRIKNRFQSLRRGGRSLMSSPFEPLRHTGRMPTHVQSHLQSMGPSIIGRTHSMISSSARAAHGTFDYVAAHYRVSMRTLNAGQCSTMVRVRLISMAATAASPACYSACASCLWLHRPRPSWAALRIGGCTHAVACSSLMLSRPARAALSLPVSPLCTMPLMVLLDGLCLMRDQFMLRLPPNTLHFAGVHSRQCLPVPCVFADRSASATDDQRRPEPWIVSTASDSVFTAAGTCHAMYFLVVATGAFFLTAIACSAGQS